jgi:hypothetical protein
MAKGEVDGGVTAGDGVCYLFGDHVQWDVIDTKLPDKIFNVASLLLMGFRRKESLG